MYNVILNTFETIGLKELDKVALMNRVDKKFAMPESYLVPMLKEMRKEYKCLVIHSNQINSYQTIYYDTAEFDFYKQHHNGWLNREKVRKRFYVESDLCFLEVKLKNNKGRTLKNRIKSNNKLEILNASEFEFLKSELRFPASALIPVVNVNYQRITFVNYQNTERLTIDLNLEFTASQQTTKVDNLIIAELKQDKKSNSFFNTMMQQARVKEFNLSKYCMAITATRPDIKQNNFKEKLYLLNQLTKNEFTTN